MTPNQPKPTTGDDFLLPCPFCGSESVGVEPLTGGFVVDCKDCGGGCGTCHDEPTAIEQWNKRKSLAEILKERGLDANKVSSEIESKIKPTTGEWTGKDFELLCASDAALRAKQVNAELAAQQEEFQRQLSAYKELYEPMAKQLAAERENARGNAADMIKAGKTLEAQLAAEREKVQRLVELVSHIPDRCDYGGAGEAYGILTNLVAAKAALAKVKEGK
jgi:Lar family restriction alleviation protein